ncbi:hypothetical protein Pmani_029948 [Petrolisthes manimaculis]|uniref:Uncharacterized protein n=1 Tax=Petrolisthes manimaculis TaxID=1843537 RepID=A0AAE1NYZ1_9EUCA|nr:hypothetical protein Pmani_029948 [Petrolisthes manimaculis]
MGQRFWLVCVPTMRWCQQSSHVLLLCIGTKASQTDNERKTIYSWTRKMMEVTWKLYAVCLQMYSTEVL